MTTIFMPSLLEIKRPIRVALNGFIYFFFIVLSYSFLWVCYCESRLRFEEREQVGVDDVGLRRDHAVGKSLYVLSVPFFRSLAESGPEA